MKYAKRRLCDEIFDLRSRSRVHCYECVPIKVKHASTVGYYVYMWFDDDALLYIGKGVDNRAWRHHHADPSHQDALCERLRHSAKSFQVRIVKDGLTESEAIDWEYALIHTLQPPGNITSGTRQ